MKTAVIGSRKLLIDIKPFIPNGTTEIISGGANGIDTFAERYADINGLKKTILKPDYTTYGKSATFIRNKQIVDLADVVIAVWDGKSKGTKYTVDYARKNKKHVALFTIKNDTIVDITTFN